MSPISTNISKLKEYGNKQEVNSFQELLGFQL